jgi:hypothetical protein
MIKLQIDSILKSGVPRAVAKLGRPAGKQSVGQVQKKAKGNWRSAKEIKMGRETAAVSNAKRNLGLASKGQKKASKKASKKATDWGGGPCIPLNPINFERFGRRGEMRERECPQRRKKAAFSALAL